MRRWHNTDNNCFICLHCVLLAGLSGLLPITPVTYLKAWRNRKSVAEAAAKEAQGAAPQESVSS